MKLIIFTAIVVFTNSVAAFSTSCNGWSQFREKCFLLVEEAGLKPFGEAQSVCKKLDNATLPQIKSAEEQHFLTHFLFKTHQTVDNVWLDARLSNSSKRFFWSDHAPVKFAKWANGHPKKRAALECVQMFLDASSEVRWTDEVCRRRNVVVCQKHVKWSTEQLQKVLMETRDQLEEVNKRLEVAEQLLHKKLEKRWKMLLHLQNETRTSSKPKFGLPNGFVYVQLPGQESPEVLFPDDEWLEVSQQYAGLFFRTVGDFAAPFNHVQDECSPRISSFRIRSEDNVWAAGHSLLPGNELDSKTEASGEIGWSTGGDQIFYLHFNTSTCEVRPRNTAVRIWKKTG